MLTKANSKPYRFKNHNITTVCYARRVTQIVFSTEGEQERALWTDWEIKWNQKLDGQVPFGTRIIFGDGAWWLWCMVHDMC